MKFLSKFIDPRDGEKRSAGISVSRKTWFNLTLRKWDTGGKMQSRQIKIGIIENWSFRLTHLTIDAFHVENCKIFEII